MHGLNVEPINLKIGDSISHAIAKILVKFNGTVTVVVTKQPKGMIGPVRKQFIKEIRKIQKQRSSTLDASKITEYTDQIHRLQKIEFAATDQAHADMYGKGVIFSTPEHLINKAPMCNMMIFATALDKETQHLITSLMPPRSMVYVIQLEKK